VKKSQEKAHLLNPNEVEEVVLKKKLEAVTTEFPDRII
jgi:hypothetical protein